MYTHKEADTHILMYLEDAVKKGYTKVSICTVDTDVLVLASTVSFLVDKTRRVHGTHQYNSTTSPVPSVPAKEVSWFLNVLSYIMPFLETTATPGISIPSTIGWSL